MHKIHTIYISSYLKLHYLNSYTTTKTKKKNVASKFSFCKKIKLSGHLCKINKSYFTEFLNIWRLDI